MAWSIDARIPVEVLGHDPAALRAALARGGAAVLAEAPPKAMPEGALAQEFWDASARHPTACACCTARPGPALALDRLFQARVRGTCPWFDRVIAIGDGAAVQAAIAQDAVTAARFRVG
jgi:hypothetical protein